MPANSHLSNRSFNIWLINLITPIFRLSFLILLLSAASSFAERNVILDENGILVEEETAEGRTLPIMIGTITMQASAEQIGAWLAAVHTYVSWQHNCEEARVITLPDGSELTYNRIASPWPVSDRDVVLRSSRETLNNGGIRFNFASTDEANLELPSGVVRMVRLKGSYVLTPVADGGTRVVYTLDSDPGGRLPKWLIKQASRDLPYITLTNLRDRAEAGLPPAA